jgi:hypothetical protein
VWRERCQSLVWRVEGVGHGHLQQKIKLFLKTRFKNKISFFLIINWECHLLLGRVEGVGHCHLLLRMHALCVCVCVCVCVHQHMHFYASVIKCMLIHVHSRMCVCVHVIVRRAYGSLSTFSSSARCTRIGVVVTTPGMTTSHSCISTVYWPQCVHTTFEIVDLIAIYVVVATRAMNRVCCKNRWTAV